MKKIALTLVAAMAFTFSFAETLSFGTEKNYDMSCDRLATVLHLDESQLDAVEAIHNSFSTQMQSLATVRGPQRRHLIHQALRKDAFQMRRVLNDKQFGTYMQLMVTTIRNRQL